MCRVIRSSPGRAWGVLDRGTPKDTPARSPGGPLARLMVSGPVLELGAGAAATTYAVVYLDELAVLLCLEA
jgi:hypothetical protein